MHRLSPSAREGFSLLFDTAPDAMVLVDGVGTIVMANVHAHRLFGFGRGELAGRSIEILVPERFRQPYLGHRAGYFYSPSVRPDQPASRARPGVPTPAFGSSSPTTERGAVAAPAPERSRAR